LIESNREVTAMVVGDGWFRGSLVELSRQECFELLAERVVGRVAYGDHDGPVVLPVNYVLDKETVLFRTSPSSPMAAHVRNGNVAFQVDEVNEDTASGWSVLLRGTATFENPTSTVATDPPRPGPWAEGSRNLVVRISPHLVTGRRLLAGSQRNKTQENIYRKATS
jgi:uncharacterized protein